MRSLTHSDREEEKEDDGRIPEICRESLSVGGSAEEAKGVCEEEVVDLSGNAFANGVGEEVLKGGARDKGSKEMSEAVVNEERH